MIRQVLHGFGSLPKVVLYLSQFNAVMHARLQLQMFD